MTYGMKSKELELLADKIDFRPKGKEEVDVLGYYDDGRRAAKNGIRMTTGSLKLHENIEAFKRGYHENVFQK